MTVNLNLLFSFRAKELICIVAFLVLVCTGAVAQTSSSGRPVYVDVTDAHHDPVASLSADNFEVKFNNRRVTVLSAERVRVHPKVAIVLDCSGSMSEENKWDYAFEFANQYTRTLKGLADVSLTLVGDHVVRVVSSSEGPPVILPLLVELHAKKDPKFGHGKTQFWDAVITALETEHLSWGDSIILITDGNEDASHSSAGDVKGRLHARGVRLFGIELVGSTSSGIPVAGPSDVDLSPIVQGTGGFLHYVSNVELPTVRRAINRIGGAILDPCLLKLDLPEGAIGKLSVNYLSNGKVDHRATVFAPDSLNGYPPGRKEFSKGR